ncbi:MAG: hypothetical protein HFACDABA_00237 [Anaerolineales bacterium]|nr:hypothetical protein [Anaerolineales bacterium]
MTSRPFLKHIPFILLILALLLFGLFTFRDYGLSWDEPLFYEYGEALGYAYAPANWFRADFDLNHAYGSSGDDHKNRGPAYLILARTPVHILQSLGIDPPSAWHLVNFLTFLLGVYFVYRLSLRWMGEWAAFGAATLFATQPLLLGHAFINPKDIPFLVFFTGALLFGFEMVDVLSNSSKNKKQKTSQVILASFFLGIATSIRVLAPLAGLLVLIYAANRQPPTANHQPPTVNHQPPTLPLLAYALLSILFMLASWPYLWESPLKNFFEVFLFMSDNPTGLQVLFGGELYRAYELPRRYLPTLLAITLTEPVWPLFALGLITTAWKSISTIRRLPTPDSRIPATNRQQPTDYWLAITAFLITFLYVLLLRPPMYDGFRHFLFILPPLFITAGLGLQFFLNRLEKIKPRVIFWLYAGMVFIILAVNILPAAKLHPFEYAYYNSLVGGTRGAFRVYETDYWLTCYKQAVQLLNARAPASLYVHREAYIAAAYASSGLNVIEARGHLNDIASGDYILVNTRANEDRKTFRDAPTLFEVGRGGAAFCVVKQAP